MAFETLLQGSDATMVIDENQYFLAALERKPLAVGHVVVISKRAGDDLFDLNADELSSLMNFAQPIARAIRKAIACQKVGVAVIGLETRHAHLHLVPISSADDLNFTRPKLAVTENQLIDVAEKIRVQLAKIKSSDTLKA
jgi:histidine triad (HIT) family protein